MNAHLEAEVQQNEHEVVEIMTELGLMWSKCFRRYFFSLFSSRIFQIRSIPCLQFWMSRSMLNVLQPAKALQF